MAGVVVFYIENTDKMFSLSGYDIIFSETGLGDAGDLGQFFDLVFVQFNQYRF